MKLTHGMSLIEVLVSLFLMSLMFLGMDALGFYTVKTDKNIWIQRVAQNQFENMRQRLYALYDGEGLDEQVLLWNKQNTEVLPNGKGKVVGTFPSYILQLAWGNTSLDEPCGKNIKNESGCIQEELIL